MAVSPGPSPFFVIFRLIIDLPEVIGIAPTAPEDMRLSNDYGTIGLRGPSCLLRGEIHRYLFKVHDTGLTGCSNLPAGALKQDTINAMRGHILGFGETTATAQDEVLRTFFISCFQKEYQRSRTLWRN
jgi:phosphatidylethanolamine-binding protein (PEBP) family uncharacterized protein